MKPKDKKISQEDQELLLALQAAQLISPTMLSMVDHYARTWQKDAVASLLETHIATEPQLADKLANAYHIDRIYSLTHIHLSEETSRLVPYPLAKKHCLLLVESESSGNHSHRPTAKSSKSKKRFELICANPGQKKLIAKIQKALGTPIRIVVGEFSEVTKAIDEAYPLTEQLPSLKSKRKS